MLRWEIKNLRKMSCFIMFIKSFRLQMGQVEEKKYGSGTERQTRVLGSNTMGATLKDPTKY